MPAEVFESATLLQGWALGAWAAAFGLVVGSFLNVVVHRLPLEQSVAFPGSHCPACDHAIRPWDNVPVLSYLLLRGRCRDCGVHISLRYPAVEAFTGAVFAVVAMHFGPVLESVVWMGFAAALITAALIDFDHQIIPDEISVGGLCIGLVVVPALQAYRGAGLVESILYSAGGALLGGGILWIVGFAHARFCVATGRTFDHWPGEGEPIPKPGELDYWIWFPGLGFGDVKLLAMIGAFLGPAGVAETITGASIVGLAMGLGWALVTRKLDAPFGFGPAIAAGALVVLLLPRPLFTLLLG